MIVSKYTTEVRFICETEAGCDESQGFDKIDEIIESAIPKIFNFDFPIFDENYRVPLCKKILKHYYTREIACETVGLWKMFLSNRLNEIMPYYNQLYESELLKFNPLYDMEIIKEGNRKNDGNNTQTANGTNTVSTDNTGNTYELYSDTPQGALNGVDSETYLTSATKNKLNTNNTSKGNSTNSSNTVIKSAEDYVESIKGKGSGISYSKMLMEFRKTFLNIDMDIINDLENLFFGLW